MKVLDKSGKEVQGATIAYDASGNPVHVTVKGVDYDPSAYKFEEATTAKKTKTTAKSGAMTTKDLKRK